MTKAVEGLTPLLPPQQQPGSARGRGGGFEQTLEQVLDRPREQAPAKEARPTSHEVRFSRHAEARLESRGLTVGPEERAKLEQAVEELGKRGARESLVLMSDRAYVVGVPDRTVITVMDRGEAHGSVFTNIDSTFVAE